MPPNEEAKSSHPPLEPLVPIPRCFSNELVKTLVRENCDLVAQQPREDDDEATKKLRGILDSYFLKLLNSRVDH